MFLSCTLQPGVKCERSSWCWLSQWVWVWTFSSTAQEYTHHRCCMDIWSLNTAQHPQEQNWTQICCTEHPASPLVSSNTAWTSFLPFWNISYLSGYISDPHPTQAICSQDMTECSHSLWGSKETSTVTNLNQSLITPSYSHVLPPNG